LDRQGRFRQDNAGFAVKDGTCEGEPAPPDRIIQLAGLIAEHTAASERLDDFVKGLIHKTLVRHPAAFHPEAQSDVHCAPILVDGYFKTGQGLSSSAGSLNRLSPQWKAATAQAFDIWFLA
jgi:hypothetical protein